MQTQKLTIIGGGIMGLMTAYYASLQNIEVTIIEKRTICNIDSASAGITRSYRRDYLDDNYTLLAEEARQLWLHLERDLDTQMLFNCGCLNLYATDITPDQQACYGAKSYQVLERNKLRASYLNKQDLQTRFPQFQAQVGYLDEDGGAVYVPNVMNSLLDALTQQNVTILENTSITAISEENNQVSIQLADYDPITTDKLVITAGRWSNEVLKLIKKNKLQLPISLDRPSQCKYYIPKTREQLEEYSYDKFPVFAYLDVGIYGHPIINQTTKGIKIGYFSPSDVKQQKKTITTVEQFVDRFLPELNKFEVQDVADTDQCYYQMTDDDDFILGQLPKFENIYVGAGWRGTGYKYAPLIGKNLAESIDGAEERDDFKRFRLERFVMV